MKQRGRESEAALQVAELAPKVGRPDPPDYLKPGEAQVWTDIVDTEAAGWFKKSQFGMLANLCRLQNYCNEIANSPAPNWQEFRQCSHELTSIARSLRLTHQSRYYPETAGKKASTSTGPRPWDRQTG